MRSGFWREVYALGLARSAAVRARLAAFRLAEILLRPGEAEDGERGWRV